jgi:hypothetical protein
MTSISKFRKPKNETILQPLGQITAGGTPDC